MANQRKTLKNLVVTSNASGVNRINVELYYSKGGINYFTYQDEKRGYWVSVTPQEHKGSFVTTVAGSGVKKFIEETKRFSQKKLDSIVIPESELQELIDHVTSKNNLTLEATQ